MSRFLARLLPLSILLAGVFVSGVVNTARAQVTVAKDLCGPALGGPNACAVGTAFPVVLPGTAVSYTFSLFSPTGMSVDLAESFPPGFVPLSTTCGPTMPAAASQMFFGPILLPPNQQVPCTITGYFNYLPATANNANNSVAVYPAGNHVGTPLVVSGQVNAVVGPPSMIPSDVSIAKTATVTASSIGTATVHYAITVTNNGPNDVYGLQSQDRVSVPTTSIPLTVTYQGNGTCTQWVTSTMSGTPVPGTSDCFGAVPSTIHSPVFVPSTSPVDFVQWSYPPLSTSVLRSGNSMVIEFDAVIAVPIGMACQLVVGGNILRNEAHIGFNIPGATTTTFETMPGNNTSMAPVPITFNGTVNPNCGKPALTITKALLPPQTTGTQFAWGTTVNYVVTLQNTSNQPIANVSLFDTNATLGDFVSGGIGTPAFTAQVMGITVVPIPGLGTAQPVTGYLNPRWMVGANIPSVAANSTVSFQLKIEYSNPECDSYPDVKAKPVLNFVRASYSDPTLGGNTITLQSDPAIAYFESPKPCNFQVTKKVTSAPQKIVFGQNTNYTVTYQNLSAQQATIGTMVDALRIVQPAYASPLNVHYNYTCSATAGVTGFTIVGGTFPIAKAGVVQVTPTALPQQGVRIIQNLVPVIFPTNGTVTCNVTINVDKPGPNPRCARKGELDNAAIMDQSALYDPNLPWPTNTNPGFYDHVALPLPQCFNLVVNKDAEIKGVNPPPWTTQNGGPLIYRLIISNLGDPIVASDLVTLTDTFAPANYAASQWTDQCFFNFNFLSAPQPLQCDFNWSPPPTSNPSTLNIQALDHNWAASPSFQVPGPYPAPYPAKPGQLCNDAAATLAVGGVKPEDWYPNDPSTWKTSRCVPIFAVTDLKVTKVVEAVGPAVLPASASFIVEVNCSLILNGTNYAPSQPLTFTLPPTPIPSQAVPNLPVGATCTLAESTLPTTPMLNKGCPSGLAVWVPKLEPKGLVLQQGGNALEVLNSLVCVKGEGAGILKVCKVAGPGIAIGTPFTFTAGSSTFTVPAGPAPGGTCVVGPSLAVGSNVTVAETMQPGITVSSIVVAPANRLLGTPNLAGGTVNVSIGSGVTEVTFTDKKTGYLEICKKGDVAGSFMVNPGGLGPFVVPPGACSPAIEVESGTVVIHELPTAGASVTDCNTIPANQQVACDPKAQTSTVTVVPGDISTMTIAMITNSKGKDPGTLAVKKTFNAPTGTSLPDLTGVVFPVDVVCTPSGPSTTLNLTAANPSQVISNIAPGSICNVAEQPLTATGKCDKPLVSVALPPTYQPGQNVTIAAPPATTGVEVANLMGCVPAGSLNVGKKMVPIPGAASPIPPGITFPVQVTCTPAGPNQIVNLTAAMPNVTLTGIAATSVCTLTELAPIGPIPSNCEWAKPTYPIGQTATIPAGSTIEKFVLNQLVCK
ncbi:DUF5979 domain-containing protein [Bradyrhizobium sp.]|jgi:hypothetical protein|uniref:DUF5979 domain-containing protein n=1 Tax=Bradyrhizobium sp. TaxID=376 RepID=UPI002E045456|nr:DUF5979 domain-containing protein [Bradyrhizobium sp.]